MSVRFLSVLLVASSAAYAADSEFDYVVKSIEKHCGVKRTHIPLMGVASFAVRVAHPGGAQSFQLAVFEDLQSPSDYSDQVELDRFMDGVALRGLSPMVRTHSRRSGESTYIFAGEAGKSTKMLIVTYEPNEATVIEVKVDFQTLLRTINHPKGAGRLFMGSKDE
ncbi:MAG TPA: hypothetical protein VLY04_15855 [Bryobacteraceae bacterium]|nr:hypothetical protein [Bryobacteraceae bacterium]